MKLESEVWGPHYWFFLHTISLTYPSRPNDVTKKKYYELIQNFPIFIPTTTASESFQELLNKYPIKPYLDTREAFIKWIYFIHNRVNEKLEKKQITLSNFYENYYEHYKRKDIKTKEYYKNVSKFIYFITIILFIILIYYLSNK